MASRIWSCASSLTRVGGGIFEVLAIRYRCHRYIRYGTTHTGHDLAGLTMIGQVRIRQGTTCQATIGHDMTGDDHEHTCHATTLLAKPPSTLSPCMHVCIYACMYVPMYVSMYICMCLCISIYLCIYVRMYVCVHERMCLWSPSRPGPSVT